MRCPRHGCPPRPAQFGGVGPSGIGGYHGKHGFDTLSHAKVCGRCDGGGGAAATQGGRTAESRPPPLLPAARVRPDHSRRPHRGAEGSPPLLLLGLPQSHACPLFHFPPPSPQVRYAPYTPAKTAQISFLLQSLPELPRAGWKDAAILGLTVAVAVLAAKVGHAF